MHREQLSNCNVAMLAAELLKPNKASYLYQQQDTSKFFKDTSLRVIFEKCGKIRPFCVREIE